MTTTLRHGASCLELWTVARRNDPRAINSRRESDAQRRRVTDAILDAAALFGLPPATAIRAPRLGWARRGKCKRRIKTSARNAPVARRCKQRLIPRPAAPGSRTMTIRVRSANAPKRDKDAESVFCTRSNLRKREKARDFFEVT